MDQLRKIYHKALQIPLENIEQLWSDYESFEAGLNRITVHRPSSLHSKYALTLPIHYRPKNS